MDLGYMISVFVQSWVSKQNKNIKPIKPVAGYFIWGDKNKKNFYQSNRVVSK